MLVKEEESISYHADYNIKKLISISHNVNQDNDLYAPYIASHDVGCNAGYNVGLVKLMWSVLIKNCFLLGCY